MRDGVHEMVTTEMAHSDCLSAFLRVLKRDFDGLGRAASDGSLDPAEFLSFVRWHKVAGYVYAVIEDAGQLELLPPQLTRGLEQSFETQTKKAERLIPEICRLRDRFARAGLDIVYLKGPFLSKRFYGDPRHRHYGDIDLLVHGREDLSRADRLLRQAGYDRLSIPLFGQAITMRFVYHYSYRSPAAKIDLHWSLRNHFSWNIDYERLWSNRQTERLGDQDFPVLSPEYVLLLLVLSILGDYQKARVRMKFLVDLYKVLRFVGDDADWETFLGQRRREGVLKITVTMLSLVLELLDARKELPRLASSLSVHEGLGREFGLAQPIELLEFSRRIPDKLRNHMRTFRLHEVGMARSIGWRLLVEPFNRAVLR